MRNPWWLLAALVGFLSVGLGAFGAHALEPRLSDDGVARWALSTRYLAAHVPLLLAVAWVNDADWGQRSARRARAAGLTCVSGLVLFSGSLGAMALTDVTALGAITPLGGLSLLAAWALLGAASLARAPAAARGPASQAAGPAPRPTPPH